MMATVPAVFAVAMGISAMLVCCFKLESTVVYSVLFELGSDLFFDFVVV